MMKKSFVFLGVLIAFILCLKSYLSAQELPKRNLSAVTYMESLRNMIFATASIQGVDPDLVEAIIAVESAFNPLAVSAKGAMGLMQLMPTTASRYGVTDPFDPKDNIAGGVRYLRDLLHRFDKLIHVLAAYNAGETAVEMYRGIPPYRETQQYVKKVLSRYRPNQKPPSSSFALSLGRWSDEIAQILKKAKDYFRFPRANRNDGIPTSAKVSSAITTTAGAVRSRRPLTIILRGPLVRTKETRPVSVHLKLYRNR